MAIDITDTLAHITYPLKSQINTPAIDIYRLAGKGVNRGLRLLAESNDPSEYLDIKPSGLARSLMLSCSVPEGTIRKGYRLDIRLKNWTTIRKTFARDAVRISDYWLASIVLTPDEFMRLSDTGVKKIEVRDEKGALLVCYRFSYQPQLHYENVKQGEQLLKLAFTRILELRKTLPVDNSQPAQPVLNRQYNLNTAYGRRMARNQAAYNYQHGSQEYRNSVDSFKFWIGLIMVVVVVVIFLIVAFLKSPEAAIKMLH